MKCSKCGGPMVKTTMDVMVDGPNGKVLCKDAIVCKCLRCGDYAAPFELTDSVNRLGGKELLMEGGTR
jgi:hypothetical protein